VSEQEREHITTGLTCWCKPVMDSYGADEQDTDDEQDESTDH